MKYDFEIYDAVLGRIGVRRGKRAKGIAFRVKNGRLEATIPYLAFCDVRQVEDIVALHRERLRAMLQSDAVKKEKKGLYDGKAISIPEAMLSIRYDVKVPRGYVCAKADGATLVYSVNPVDELSSDHVSKEMSRLILSDLKRRYGENLLHLVHECASQYGIRVKAVRLGHGRRTLGHCSCDGVITISSCMLFYPEHLRRYVVCHELAHITHPNHSKEFHALCNHYCQGNGELWRKELNKYVIPLTL